VAGEPVQAGLSAFADDTAFLDRTSDEAQCSAAVVEAVLALVCLNLAPAKSLHMLASYVDSTDSGRLSLTLDEITAAERVVIGGITVPLVGADEGLRYLGFQMDGLCDWGDQAAIIPQIMHNYRTAVMPTRLRKTETAYLYEAVLVPRLLYSLILASITDEELGKMDSAMWMWQGRKLGLAPTQSRSTAC
jgi:hypothetical protein